MMMFDDNEDNDDDDYYYDDGDAAGWYWLTGGLPFQRQVIVGRLPYQPNNGSDILPLIIQFTATPKYPYK